MNHQLIVNSLDFQLSGQLAFPSRKCKLMNSIPVCGTGNATLVPCRKQLELFYLKIPVIMNSWLTKWLNKHFCFNFGKTSSLTRTQIDYIRCTPVVLQTDQQTLIAKLGKYDLGFTCPDQNCICLAMYKCYIKKWPS